MRTVVSIYILIPLILVPQLLLGGAMIKFDDLHKSITRKEYVPALGDVMATRWAYEAIMVEGYKNNRYNKPTFEYKLEIEQNNYYKDELIPALKDIYLNDVLQKTDKGTDRELVERKLGILKYHISDLGKICNANAGKWTEKLNISDFNQRWADSVEIYLDNIADILKDENRGLREEVASIEKAVRESLEGTDISKLATGFNNQRLEDIVRNQGDLKARPYIELKGHLVQKTNPIFMKPTSNIGRAHFYSPYKKLGNLKIDTLIFNVVSLWLMVGVFFLTLYFNLLKKFIDWLEALKLPFWRKFGRQSL
jgi:hypothetical protein